MEFLVFYAGFHKGFDGALEGHLKHADFLINGNNNCSHAWTHEQQDEGDRPLAKISFNSTPWNYELTFLSFFLENLKLKAAS